MVVFFRGCIGRSNRDGRRASGENGDFSGVHGCNAFIRRRPTQFGAVRISFALLISGSRVEIDIRKILASIVESGTVHDRRFALRNRKGSRFDGCAGLWSGRGEWLIHAHLVELDIFIVCSRNRDIKDKLVIGIRRPFFAGRGRESDGGTRNEGRGHGFDDRGEGIVGSNDEVKAVHRDARSSTNLELDCADGIGHRGLGINRAIHFCETFPANAPRAGGRVSRHIPRHVTRCNVAIPGIGIILAVNRSRVQRIDKRVFRLRHHRAFGKRRRRRGNRQSETRKTEGQDRSIPFLHVVLSLDARLSLDGFGHRFHRKAHYRVNDKRA